MLLDPTLKTLLILCFFFVCVKVGIQLLTSKIINISHCNSILDSNQVMHLLFAWRLLLSKLSYIQDGNTLLSLSLYPCRSISFPLHSPHTPPYRPLFLSSTPFSLIFLSLCPQYGADRDLSDSVKLLSTSRGLC